MRGEGVHLYPHEFQAQYHSPSKTNEQYIGKVDFKDPTCVDIAILNPVQKGQRHIEMRKFAVNTCPLWAFLGIYSKPLSKLFTYELGKICSSDAN
jgi:hypothetical protein